MDNNAPVNQNTPVNPSANRSPLIPAIRGPIMLIIIGVLFALEYSAGISFWKTWPVLLIVLGVLHLLERRADVHRETGP